MTEVTNLNPKRTTGLVPILTELLARAQRGEIDQVALVYTQPGSEDYGTWISDRTAPGGSTLRLLGAITDLQFTALTLHNEAQR